MSPDPHISQAIAALDFRNLKRRLSHAIVGHGWPRPYCDAVHAEYLRFLTLIRDHPEDVIVPSQDIDKFWHGHILDTKNYSDECMRAVGRPVLHDPDFGMGGAQDRQKLDDGWNRTLSLYRTKFGTDAPPEIWKKPEKCGPVVDGNGT